MTDRLNVSVVAGPVVITFLFIIFYNFNVRKGRPLPPGPKALPIVGNLRDMPRREGWLTITQWAREFGDVCYLHLWGQSIVYLSSAEAALDLLDKRGSIYSDKSASVMAGELCGLKDMVSFTRYGDTSRRQRKLLQLALGVNCIRTYAPLLELETRAFVSRLSQTPDEYVSHIRRYAGSMVLLVVYGYEVTSNDDEFLGLAERSVSLISKSITSRRVWAVDVFPVLKHIPLWFPGAQFKRSAIEWRHKLMEFVDKPYQFVKEAVDNGTAIPSFCSTLLRQSQENVDAIEEHDIRWAATSIYSASIDTTNAVFCHFLLAMILYPEIQRKAQLQLDSVVGKGKLPTFSDRDSLPYIDCIMTECFRWGAPVPINLPHRLMEDDIYRGMLIPKGTLVFANIWAILRDESVYPDPEAFCPERFENSADLSNGKKVPDPRTYVFGFGRRRCPGANLVESSVWLIIASFLATFEISKAIDQDGNVIEPDIAFDNPIFRTPRPFACRIKLRPEANVILNS